jgi:hypothetical protein
MAFEAATVYNEEAAAAVQEEGLNCSPAALSILQAL